MDKYFRKLVQISSVLAVLSFNIAVFIPSAIAVSQTFTVNVTTDESDTNIGNGICETANLGECSLRAAIEEANANEGYDTIEFNIPGDPSSVHTIIPTINNLTVTDPVTIDGYSQPGASVNTAPSPNPIDAQIRILLHTDNPTVSSPGLTFANGSSGSILRGLSITGFSKFFGVQDEEPSLVSINDSDITIAGNFIGVNPDGYTASQNGNDNGLNFINGVRTTVGGLNPADRNMFYTYSEINTTAAIFGGGINSVIYGNYIGLARDGITDLTPNEESMDGEFSHFSSGINLVSGVQDSNHIGTRVGGPSAAYRNVISGMLYNIVLSSDGHIIQGNYIGTDYTGHPRSSITNGIGFVMVASSNILIGGTDPGEGNVIAGVKGAGILISSLEVVPYNMTFMPYNISLLGNHIFDIGISNFEVFGEMNQGIDIAMMVDENADFLPDSAYLRGPNANDMGDSDDGPNHLINYPVLKSAVQVGETLNINFDMDTSASVDGQYRVEFFANDNSTIFGYGPGQEYLGYVDVEPGTNINASLNLGTLRVEGKPISATATAHNSNLSWGYGSTSEFSQNILVGSDTDFDADGISDITEDKAMNNGDGNNDGIPDKYQSTVSSYSVGTVPVTFVTDGCSSNSSVSLLNVSSLSETDQGFSYPYGLLDFVLNCSRGDGVTVTKYIYDENITDSTDFFVRKYRPQSSSFETVQDSTIEIQHINSHKAVVMSYSMIDGGALDDDGVANGVIVDPVGIALVVTSSRTIDNNNDRSTGIDGNTSGMATNNAGKKNSRGMLSRTGVLYIGYLYWVGLILVVIGTLEVLLCSKRHKRQIPPT